MANNYWFLCTWWESWGANEMHNSKFQFFLGLIETINNILWGCGFLHKFLFLIHSSTTMSKLWTISASQKINTKSECKWLAMKRFLRKICILSRFVCNIALLNKNSNSGYFIALSQMTSWLIIKTKSLIDKRIFWPEPHRS